MPYCFAGQVLLHGQNMIKPHPRECKTYRYRDAGLDVDDSNSTISQEVLLANAINKPKLIIGFFSTSLITAKLFFGIKTASIGKIEDFESILGYGKDINNFINTFNNFLYVPKSYVEFENIIKSIKEE